MHQCGAYVFFLQETAACSLRLMEMWKQQSLFYGANISENIEAVDTVLNELQSAIQVTFIFLYTGEITKTISLL